MYYDTIFTTIECLPGGLNRVFPLPPAISADYEIRAISFSTASAGVGHSPSSRTNALPIITPEACDAEKLAREVI